MRESISCTRRVKQVGVVKPSQVMDPRIRGNDEAFVYRSFSAYATAPPKTKKRAAAIYKAAADLFPSGFMFDGAPEEKEHQRAIRTT